LIKLAGRLFRPPDGGELGECHDERHDKRHDKLHDKLHGIGGCLPPILGGAILAARRTISRSAGPDLMSALRSAMNGAASIIILHTRTVSRAGSKPASTGRAKTLFMAAKLWSRRRRARVRQNHRASRPGADGRCANLRRNENRGSRARRPTRSVRHWASWRTQHRAPADSTRAQRARASLCRPDDRAILLVMLGCAPTRLVHCEDRSIENAIAQRLQPQGSEARR
jgi:hypothetical protein